MSLASPDHVSVHPDPTDLRADLERAASKIANLETALQTSRTIGTAIGVVVERFKLSPEDAFKVLVQLSQAQHRKLQMIANDLVYSGELPAD